MARLLRAGAADTILKPFHPAELIARVETHLRLRRLRAELREKNAILEKLSTTDPVTGLRSRRWVRDVLALEVLRASRYRAPLAVVMADLDYFKRINDGHGHLAGDAVLEATARVILERLRETDVAGRYGGEEIVLVLPQTDLAGAVALAEQLRIAVATNTCRFGDAPLRVTLSLGVAEFVAGDDGDRLIEAADAALYAAKGAGRNCVVPAQRRAGVDTPVGKSRPVPRAGRKR
jgi:diguanylate cyclase (GGDEF)-like protein